MLEVNGCFKVDQIVCKGGDVKLVLISDDLPRDQKHTLTDLEGEEVDVSISMSSWRSEPTADKKGQTLMPSPIDLLESDISTVVSYAAGTQDLRAALAKAGHKWDGEFAPADVLTKASYETLMAALGECLVCNCFTGIGEYCTNCFEVTEEGFIQCRACGVVKSVVSEPILHTDDCSYYRTLQERMAQAQGEPVAVGRYTAEMLEASDRDQAETIVLGYSGHIHTLLTQYGISSSDPERWEKLAKAAKEGDDSEMMIEFIQDAKEAAKIFKERFGEEAAAPTEEPAPVSICASCEKQFECPVDVFNKPEFVGEGECVHYEEHKLRNSDNEEAVSDNEEAAPPEEEDPFTPEAMAKREKEQHLAADVLVAPETPKEPEPPTFKQRMEEAGTIEEANAIKGEYQDAIGAALVEAGEPAPSNIQAVLTRKKMLDIVTRVFNRDNKKGVLLRKLTNDAYAANAVYHEKWGGTDGKSS